MEANGINYYKGVLLCSRPNQSPSIFKKKQFCGRVSPQDQLGLAPVKALDPRKPQKKIRAVLVNHKKWLQKFKKQVKQSKQQQQKQKLKAIQRLQKIKQEGYQQRQKLKNESKVQTKLQVTKPVQNIPNLKKKQKPAWAKTAQEAEKSQQKQVDDLLDFFNNEKETQLKQLVSDQQVKSILKQLKNKIEKIKQKQDWKNNQIKKIQEQKQQQNDKDDVLSKISRQSGTQSIASKKTQERVEELQKKKQTKEWDKMTASQKKTMASVDEQIAKNIADEVLRNYPSLKHHSNQSLRQIIQKHAHEQVKS